MTVKNKPDVLKRLAMLLNGKEIENLSFKCIEDEIPSEIKKQFSEREWKIARRLIHTTADFSIISSLKFNNDPIGNGIDAIKKGYSIFSDSNMIKSGISIARLNSINTKYTRNSIQCYIADPDVAELAKKNNITRAYTAVEKAKPILNNSIVLIGNAPLALGNIIRLFYEENIRPALIIGMPVGFVNVVESKDLLLETDIPHITIEGRRGGSTLAVATLHAIIESY